MIPRFHYETWRRRLLQCDASHICLKSQREVEDSHRDLCVMVTAHTTSAPHSNLSSSEFSSYSYSPTSTHSNLTKPLHSSPWIFHWLDGRSSTTPAIWLGFRPESPMSACTGNITVTLHYQNETVTITLHYYRVITVPVKSCGFQ